MSDIIALGAALIAAGSLGAALFGLKFSRDAVRQSGEARATSINIARRQGVIDLHMAWREINSIDCVALIGPDVKKAANALSLTASLWNHDVIEKEILY